MTVTVQFDLGESNGLSEIDMAKDLHAKTLQSQLQDRPAFPLRAKDDSAACETIYRF